MVTDEGLGNLIMGFILILVGVVLIGVVADSITANTTLKDVINETIAISSTNNTQNLENISIASGAGQTANISLTNIFYFGNSTNNTDLISINISTDVNWTRGGVILVNRDIFNDGAYNITYYWASDTTGQTAEDDLTSVTYFGNTSLNTYNANININTHVNWTTAGVITVVAVNYSDDNYNISYGFEGAEYVTNPTARTLLPLVTLFFAIAVMFLGVVVAKNGLEKMGFF